MRGKKRSWVTILVSMLAALCLFSFSVLATDNEDADYGFTDGMIVDGTLLIGGSSAYSGDYDLEPYGDYLAIGGCAITCLDANIAQVEGHTSCYRTCDEVYLGIFMDRLESNGNWQTVWQKELTEEDTYYLAYDINVYVKSGYYYRVRAGHIARQGNVLESNTSMTDGIYFG